MSVTSRALWSISVFLFILAIMPAPPAEASEYKRVYLKDGSVIECDLVWDGRSESISYKKGSGVNTIPGNRVDLKKTFGKQRGEAIAKRYERRAKKRAEKRKPKKPIIVTPYQERCMRINREKAARKAAAAKNANAGKGIKKLEASGGTPEEERRVIYYQGSQPQTVRKIPYPRPSSYNDKIKKHNARLKQEYRKKQQEVERYNAQVKQKNAQARKEYEAEKRAYEKRLKQYNKMKREVEKHNAKVNEYNARLRREKANAKSINRSTGRKPWLHESFLDMMGKEIPRR